ncbi:HAD-superfamily subfamily IIA hydrolase [Sesbania bispinosa]|nr:HAD-superfamily subfamily IIA hydrolase [Sesbania bispinosa]
MQLGGYGRQRERETTERRPRHCCDSGHRVTERLGGVQGSGATRSEKLAVAVAAMCTEKKKVTQGQEACGGLMMADLQGTASAVVTVDEGRRCRDVAKRWNCGDEGYGGICLCMVAVTMAVWCDLTGGQGRAGYFCVN